MARASVLCLEGPSAVGKSTVASCLAGRGYLVIPEVNELFRHDERVGSDWYFRRQVDRYARSIASAREGQPVVLDGDPFQPLWYNWIYPEYEPLAQVLAFYRKAIKAIDAGDIVFPDFYAVLQAPAEHLLARKADDATRLRRNFDRHLRMIEPQCRYFEQVRALGIVEVEFIEKSDAEVVAQKIAEQRPVSRESSKDSRLFSTIADWLEATRPFPG